MPETLARLEVEDLQKQLGEVQEILHRHKVVEDLVHRQDMPKHGLVEKLVHKQHLAEVRARLERLHAADIAFILDALPLEERLEVWDLVKADRDGEILLEVSDAVRESLIKAMDSRELVAAAETLEADEIADIAPDLPKDVIEEVVQSLPLEERDRLRSALSYPEGTVGALMNFDHVAVREDVTLEAATSQLRRLDELPDHTDQLFVIDRDQGLTGTLPLARLIVTDLHILVSSVAIPESVKFGPQDAAEEAANAFERYGLVSAPVVDLRGRLIGRLTVDAVVDYIRKKSAETQLAEAGLAAEEDIFAPVLNSFKNRWSWLAINLVTAFIASRVIGLFEDSIERLVALAALMPIVAGIGGNSGNQTITMIVRALALAQIHGTWRKLLAKELGVALLNGAVWGTLLGAIAYAFYGNVALGGVMALAMILNLLLAAFMGVTIPWLRARFGKDPAVGSSVLITACTDSGGFFIFLGLATLFLV
ncbi:MAG TPA: magnesium transporter [Burkholderiales bacterium]|nr:magnesium transporter [Burkholderiales bacterium]HXJ10260.1 magnesium transporter [Burkholderiales bacterium]